MSYPSACSLAQHTSKPNLKFGSSSGENQYILQDGGRGIHELGKRSCKWLCERRERSFASSSWELSRVNHNVSVSLSPLVIYPRKPSGEQDEVQTVLREDYYQLS